MRSTIFYSSFNVMCLGSFTTIFGKFQADLSVSEAQQLYVGWKAGYYLPS